MPVGETGSGGADRCNDNVKFRRAAIWSEHAAGRIYFIGFSVVIVLRPL
jgi:hypothetical protein